MLMNKPKTTENIHPIPSLGLKLLHEVCHALPGSINCEQANRVLTDAAAGIHRVLEEELWGVPLKIPLIVEVETKDGRIRNVVLCMGHTDLEDHENDESIAYYFDDDEASEPKHLIGLGVFGDVEEEGDAIVKLHGISTFPEFLNTPPKEAPPAPGKTQTPDPKREEMAQVVLTHIAPMLDQLEEDEDEPRKPTPVENLIDAVLRVQAVGLVDMAKEAQAFLDQSAD
tara:strand:+ start:1869 stop:2549 length:681 start_codon:yes stop_codon:yes gene_type:complete